MKFTLLISLALFSASVMADMAQQIEIVQPHVRAAILQQRNSAAFMTLKNNGSTAELVNAHSPVAKIVELHTHINDNGVMRMRRVPKITVPDHGEVKLQPGGYHVMLLGLKRNLRPGDEVDIKLDFADGSSRQLKVPVQKMMMRPMKNMHKHMMDGKLPAMKMH